MIEGVNATIANAALVRPVSEQVVSARSYAENPKQVQQVPQAPYISPYISIDYTSDKAVLQIRDSDSGEVIRQIPTRNQLDAYSRASESSVTSAATKPVAEKSDAPAAAQASAAPVAKDTGESDAPAPAAAQTAASVLISA